MSSVATDRLSSRSQPSRGSATTSCLSIPRGSTIPRPALNATISSVAPGAARWVSPAAALCTPRRRGRGCSRSRRRGCSRFEAEPIQRRHMALDPLHLDALFGCPPPSGSERLVDRVDRGDGPPALGEIDGVAARAAAYVERATGHRGIRAVEQMSRCVGNVPSLPGSEPQPVQQRVGEYPVTSKRSTIVTGDCCTQHACQPGEGEVLEREHPTPRLMRLSAIRRQSGYSPRRGLSTATATSHDQPCNLGRVGSGAKASPRMRPRSRLSHALWESLWFWLAISRPRVTRTGADSRRLLTRWPCRWGRARW